MNKLKALRGMIAGGIGALVFGVAAVFLSGPVGWVVAGAAVACGVLAIKSSMDYTDPLEGARAGRLSEVSDVPGGSTYSRMASEGLVAEPSVKLKAVADQERFAEREPLLQQAVTPAVEVSTPGSGL